MKVEACKEECRGGEPCKAKCSKGFQPCKVKCKERSRKVTCKNPPQLANLVGAEGDDGEGGDDDDDGGDLLGGDDDSDPDGGGGFDDDDGDIDI